MSCHFNDSKNFSGFSKNGSITIDFDSCLHNIVNTKIFLEDTKALNFSRTLAAAGSHLGSYDCSVGQRLTLQAVIALIEDAIAFECWQVYPQTSNQNNLAALNVHANVFRSGTIAISLTNTMVKICHLTSGGARISVMRSSR